MFFPRILAAALLTTTLGTGAYALAQGTTGAVPAAPGPAIGAAGQPPLPMAELLDKVAAQGYRDAQGFERKSDKLVEVKATNADGRRVELDVDARTGEVLKVDRD
ncbi:PepSY domain-containing protein [Niveispirillum fermenti]|uniref:PepSY domain-containing protein n=1 Tax=Niveispirillum fermenti TaxID=1233113 RepID=UPI003A8C6A43